MNLFPMRIKHYLISTMLFLSIFSVYSQNAKPFAPAKFNERLKGDILLIGNNILSIHPINSYNTVGNPSSFNDDLNMMYVDMDNDASTFSSSSARLEIPNASRNCYRIKYAALYWSATNRAGGETNLTNIKFRTPSSSDYVNITGQIVYNEAIGNLLGNSCKPYVAYADVTSLINSSNAEGDYLVANIRASLGDNDINDDSIVDCPGGNSGGWSLFIVYEDPKLPSKFITTFDGFSGITGTNELTIPISGFRTNPTGNVNAKLAFSTLEGDNRVSGDGMQIRGVNTNPTFSNVTSLSRPTANFFNSSFSDVNGSYTNRTPASQNTLGYDGGVTTIANPNQSVLGNNETQAEVKLISNGDQYYLFFLAFSVENIEPNVVLTKSVEDMAGQNIDNQNVTLCQELNYRIGFDNIGNDDAQGLITQPAPYGRDYVLIKDILPNNVTLVNCDITNVPGTIIMTNPTNSRDLSFYVPKRFFTTSETQHEIIIKARVVCSCYEVANACSNIIKNQAFVDYQGVISDIYVINNPSFSQFNSTCLSGVAESTNSLVNIDSCNFTSEVYFCGNSVTLTAANDYDSYTWTGPSGAIFTPNNISQTVNVNLLGTYTVNGYDASCRPIVQTFNVNQYGSSLTNPIIAYDENATPVFCSDTGERLPYIFLCGSTDSQLLQTNIFDATSVQWFLYNEASCGVYPPNNCPTTTDSCWTNLVGTGANYTVTQAGKYRVVFTFPGGCTKTFYFNVYQNLLNPQVVAKNIICGSPGTITVNNVPNTGYQFQLLNGSTVVFPWQSSNIFNNINSAGNYTVQVQPTAFSGGCVFNMNTIGIQIQDVTAAISVSNPVCYGDSNGTITAIATGGIPPYAYSLTSPIAIGPQAGNTFTSLPAGMYTVNIRDSYGCTYNSVVMVASPAAPLSSTILSTSNNSIEVNASGGNPSYQYSLDNQPYQASNTFSNLTAGNHFITVLDSNGCIVINNITINPSIILSVSDHFITSNDLVGEQNVGSVLSNDTLNGTEATTSNVSITVVTPAEPKSTGAPFPYLNNQGTVLLPEGTPPGKYMIEYKICDSNDLTNCSSAFVKVNVTSKQIDAPSGNTIQEFTDGNTLENLVVVGDNINWYSLNTTGRIANSNVIPLPFNAVLEDGKTYYASQTINDVEGFYRLAVTALKTLSVKDFIFNNLKTYPNPVKSIVTIQNSSLIEKIEVLNNLGQNIIKLEPNEFKSDVDLTNLSNGLYFVKITSSNKEKIVKIIKE